MKTIKTIGIFLLALALFLTIPSLTLLNLYKEYKSVKIITKVERSYSVCAEVVEVNEDGTTFEDTNGTLWSVYDTDFVEGEHVTLQMSDNGTSTYNSDDYIKAIE